jgi:hypothetical protein
MVQENECRTLAGCATSFNQFMAELKLLGNEYELLYIIVILL